MFRTTFAAAVLFLLGPLVAAASFEGQVVCSECWFEADRASVAYGTPGDIDCARRCAGQGIPPALAIKQADDFELLLLGDAPDGSAWLDLTGRFVRATGRIRMDGDKRRLDVDSLETLAESPWPAATTAPTWTDLNGREFTLDALRGRVVVLNFWATWCLPCREEMPDLVRLQSEQALHGVQVVGASADPIDQSEAVTDYARELELNFPVVVGATTSDMQAFGLGTALPATVVLDRDGEVVARFDGIFKPKKLEAAVERALKGEVELEDDHDHEDDHGHDHGHDHGKPTDASLVPS